MKIVVGRDKLDEIQVCRHSFRLLYSPFLFFVGPYFSPFLLRCVFCFSYACYLFFPHFSAFSSFVVPHLSSIFSSRSTHAAPSFTFCDPCGLLFPLCPSFCSTVSLTWRLLSHSYALNMYHCFDCNFALDLLLLLVLYATFRRLMFPLRFSSFFSFLPFFSIFFLPCFPLASCMCYSDHDPFFFFCNFPRYSVHICFDDSSFFTLSLWLSYYHFLLHWTFSCFFFRAFACLPVLSPPGLLVLYLLLSYHAPCLRSFTSSC